MNGQMDKEKQIEEMAYEMTQYKGKMCERIEHNNCLLKFHTNAFINCNYCKLAEHLITEKGYRKERQGEWEKVNEKYPRYVCTACNHLYNNKEYKYCPNCGAKMKGE